uniref:peroxidase n=1 Tax=Populus alba TaxID=43335 RepID=A0A4U5MB58_POPAL|nr:hypothetical protein D5086_0000310610 [Populus alba]
MAAKAGAAASFMFMLFLLNIACHAQLSPTFYDSSCPNALSAIRTAIRSAIASDRRMAASLIRLHFHDCFVQVGGPSYAVKLGRRDSTTASRTLANAELPAFFESLESLISRFQKKGLTARDMVALSAPQEAMSTCWQRLNLSPARFGHSNSFDNNYFKNLMQNKGLLQSDQVLFNGGSTDSIVSEYSRNPARFKSDFGSAMIKMGDIGLLTGSSGQIRRICSAVN